MAEATDRKKVEKVIGIKELKAQVDNMAATLRRLVKKAEVHWGTDIDGDGKAGWFKPTALIGVTALFLVITLGGWAANELVWKVGDSAYVDIEGDATFNSVTASVTMTGGTIDNATIGVATPSTGAFTTLSASGAVDLNAAVTCTNVTVDAGSTLDLDAGTITVAWTNSNVLTIDGTTAVTTNQPFLSATGVTNTFVIVDGLIKAVQ